jgi:hypothetical protein
VPRLAEAGELDHAAQVEAAVGGACPSATSILGVLARSSRV